MKKFNLAFHFTEPKRREGYKSFKSFRTRKIRRSVTQTKRENCSNELRRNVTENATKSFAISIVEVDDDNDDETRTTTKKFRIFETLVRYSTTEAPTVLNIFAQIKTFGVWIRAGFQRQKYGKQEEKVDRPMDDWEGKKL